MSPLLQSLLALTLGAVAALAVRAVERARPRLFHRSFPALTWGVVVASAVGAAVAPPAPTGIDAVDVAYRAFFAVVVTLAAGRATRNARLVSGALAAVGTAGAWPWTLAAFGALGLATGSAAIRRPARPLGVVIGALQVQALLRLEWPDVSYLTAMLAAVAAVVLVVSGLRHARRREKRPARIVLGGVGAAGFAVVVLLAFGLLSIQSDLVGGARAADAGLDAMRAGETSQAVEQLARAERRLEQADDGLRAPWMKPGRYLPVVGRYLDAGRELTSAAAGVVAPALDSAEAADSDALRIRDARIDLDAVAALAPPLRATLDAVPAARVALAELREEELPGPVAREVRDLDATMARAIDDGETALEALDLVPQLLGGDGPRRWFVLMQTPSEQRASGGIAGGFGELLVDDGRLELVRAGEGSGLNEPGVQRQLGSVAADYRRFAGFGPERFFQNVTNVPHFPSVGRVISEVYPQAGGSPVDGVLSVDPKVLAALLSLSGPIEVPSWPTPLDAENAERVLLYEQYLRLTEPGEGEQFVTEVIEATFTRLRSAALPPAGKVVNTLAPLVRANRLKLYSPHPDEQELFTDIGVAGALPEADGDYFQLVTQNSGESKIDWFQQRSVTYDVRHDPVTGEVAATATVTITNNAPAQGESELLIGGSFDEPTPLGRSRLFVELWSALDLEAATLDGQRITFQQAREHDRNLYWGLHTLLPGQTITFELHLRGLLDPGAPYRLDLGMQPVVNPDRVRVSVTPTRGSGEERSWRFRQHEARALTAAGRP